LSLKEHGVTPWYALQLSTELFPDRNLQSIGSRAGRGILPFEILEITNRELAMQKFTSECTPSYVSTIRDFVGKHIVGKLAHLRRSRGMYDALEREAEWDAETDLYMGASSWCNRL
jgi:DNA-directed RNA polymerase III subunit RPC1